MKKLNIQNNVKTMASVSNRLDSTFPKVASAVDSVNESYVKIMKEAQYVGIQGYAIRNKRCFDNCLRQKRSTSDASYDNIWSECHKEYLTALNDPKNEKWNKYASKEENPHTNVSFELVKQADSLLDIAEKLGKGKEAEELTRVANSLLKEANWFTEQINKLSPSLINTRKVLEDLKRNFNSSLQTINSSGGSNDVGSQVKKNLYSLIGQYIQDFSSSRDFRGINTRSKSSIQKITNDLGQIRGQIGAAKQLPELASGIENGLAKIDELIAFTVADAKQEKAQSDTTIPEEASPELSPTSRNPIQNSLQVLMNTPNGKNQLGNLLRQHGISIASIDSSRLLKSSQADFRSYLNEIDSYIKKNGPEAIIEQLQSSGINAQYQPPEAESPVNNTETPEDQYPIDGDENPYRQMDLPYGEVSNADENINPIDIAGTAIQNAMNEIGKLPKNQNTLGSVAEAIRASGWQNANEAQHIAQWLMGFKGANSFKKRTVISQRNRIV